LGKDPDQCGIFIFRSLVAIVTIFPHQHEIKKRLDGKYLVFKRDIQWGIFNIGNQIPFFKLYIFRIWFLLANHIFS